MEQITGSNTSAILALHDFFLPFFLNVYARTWFLICRNFLLLFFLQRTYMVSDLFSNSLLLFFSQTYVHVDFVIVPLPWINTCGYFFSCETGKVSRKQWEKFWYATVCFYTPSRFQSPQIWRRRRTTPARHLPAPAPSSFSLVAQCKKNGPYVYLLWILVFDDQHNQIELMNLQVSVL